MSRPTLSSLIGATTGGVIVAAALLVTGAVGSGHTTTVVQQAPLVGARNVSSTGLTPRDIYKRAAPGVVYIRSEVVQPSQFDPFSTQEQQQTATGSGFVVNRNGTILTNAHVIDGALKITVQFGDNRSVSARVIGKDLNSDLALLRVSPDGLDLRPLQLGDSKSVQVGDPTIAIGNPFGLDRTLTTGVVSAIQRRIPAPNGFAIENVIQTDAPINPGNSGGPLLDAAGRVIGINSQIETGGGRGSVGIGFAVPIDTAKQVIPQLEKGGKINTAFLGLTTISIDASLGQLNLPVDHGALVQSVTAGSPADKAGIHGGSVTADLGGQPIVLGGDIVTSLDGKPISSSDELGSLVAAHKPGDKVKLGLLRKGGRTNVDVTLGTRPNSLPASG